MVARVVAVLYGAAFLAAGIMGFLQIGRAARRGESFTEVERTKFGAWGTNWGHDGAHLLFGVLGLLAFRSESMSRGFLQLTAASLGALGITGFLTEKPLGIFTVHKADNITHVALAVPAFALGFLPIGAGED